MGRSDVLSRGKRKRAEALIGENRFSEARDLYQNLCRKNPHDEAIWLRLGFLNRRLGDTVKSENCCRRVLELRPDYADGFNALGLALEAQGRGEEAEGMYRKAVSLQPSMAAACNNLGNVLAQRKHTAEAVRCFRRALELQPGAAVIHNNLGQALLPLGYPEEAAASLRRALELGLDSAAAHSNLLLCLNYLPGCRPDELFAEHRRWAARYASAIPPASRNPSDPQPERCLRIGYVSPDFRQHPAAGFIESFLRGHDHHAFEVYCYSDVRNPDAITERLQAHADHWQVVCDTSDVTLAELVQGDGIDILIDLAGHTAGNRLLMFARRPAPVQVSYLGYANTTGLVAVDYRITDVVADPPGEGRYYTEALWRLDSGFSCYTPPREAPDVGPLPAGGQGTITFGSLNMLGKLNQQVLELWSRILAAVPGSRLLIYRDELRDETAQLWYQTFARYGIAQPRVELRHTMSAGRQYLDVYNEIDIALDTFPWNGHVTSCEALWMGVPVVTLACDRHSSRTCASVLKQLGLQELIAQTPDDYIAAATALATDRDRLVALRGGLRQRMVASPLCDSPGFTARLEAAYRKMWNMWCEGRE